jgi:hypothetical protein
MEKKIVENLREPSLATVLKEVQSLKTALEVKNLKEQTIVAVLRVEDKEVLEKIATAIRKVLSPPSKEIDEEGPKTTQGDS